MRRRWMVLLATSLLAVGLATVPAWGTPPPGEGSAAELAWFSQQPVAWTGCQRGPDDNVGQALDTAGARCAEVRVPLDYRDPSGETITVAMSRLAATNTANRIGVLLVNSGVPGGPGLPLPLGIRQTLGEVAARYDIIGMDPRGVGRSTPVDCAWPTGAYRRSAGRDRADFDHIVGFESDLADRCEQYGGPLLPYITTRNTARDMDVVRGVLGEEKISYVGFSYGTYLGAAYTALFPDRTDRVVLDAPVDPQTWSAIGHAGSGPANEAALWGWAAWAAAHHDTHGLGRTSAEVVATVHRILRAAEQRPLQVGEYLVDQHLVPLLLSVGLLDDRDAANTGLAGNVRVLKAAAAGEQVQPTPGLEQNLRLLLTGARSSSASAQAAIVCGDAAVPRDRDYYWRQVQRSRPTQPVFGPLVNNVSPCAFWPAAPIEQPVRQPGDVPALIVAAEGDPNTIYQNGITLHQLMPQSRLVTLQARIHISYGHYGNACVDQAVNTYLASGRPPTSDVVCTP